MLSFDQVKDILNSELDPRIKAARAMKDKLRLHVDGIGLQEYLARINNYENEGQFDARKKHAISNKFLTEELLRPVDNAFHARGGSHNYKFSTDQEKKEQEFIKRLMNVKGAQTLSAYMENEWFHWYVVDPNGLTFMEIQDDETTEIIDDEPITETEQVLRPTYKSISEIRDYEQNGNTVDWVIFEPHVKINSKKQEEKVVFFWAVDELFYYLYIKNDKGLSLARKIENSFGRVPAILNSDISDSITGWKKSVIDSQIELLDKYLVSNSVLSITEFFHNYLREWTYVGDCKQCNGSGKDLKNDGQECFTCSGTGKASRKDATDRIELKIPEGDQTKIDPPAGYIVPPIDAWTSQTNSVDRTWDIIYFSQWGTTVSKDTKNETATGRFLDAQPVNNRLNKYSISIETSQSALATFLGEWYFPETFEQAVIQKGRRYLIETPDQIWKKYLESKKDDAPVSVLDLLLTQYLESEFRENEQLFIYEDKKVRIEPFVHWDVVTVQDLGPSEEEYSKKLYYSDWIKTKTIHEVITTPLVKLQDELTVFAKNKGLKQNNNNDGN